VPVAYADVFDYPLRAVEIHQYLHGVVASWADTLAALEDCVGPGGPLGCRDGFYTLQGRESIVPLRVARSANAKRLWLDAVRYGRLMAQLPFVRLVAVTGSLAWDNIDRQGDIDYLVISTNGRLWLCRAFIALLARIASRGWCLHLRELHALRADARTDRARFVHGLRAGANEAGRRSRGLPGDAEAECLDPWTSPQRTGAGARGSRGDIAPTGLDDATVVADCGTCRLAAAVALGTMLEWVEMKRARRIRLRVPRREQGEISYTPDCYKAHRAAHKGRVLSAFAERIETLKANAL
jgi:hypothetical protein